MRRLFATIFLALATLPIAAQENGQTLPPNYRVISRVVADNHSPYFLDSLQARFWRCDTSLTVDDLRCLYFGGSDVSLADCHRRYQLLLGRFGRHQGKANEAWWQYQMLLTAVWSTGNGSKKHPLHVRDEADLQLLTNLESGGDILRRNGLRFVRVRVKMPDGSHFWYSFRRRK